MLWCVLVYAVCAPVPAPIEARGLQQVSSLSLLALFVCVCVNEYVLV